jgi:hypothetical protein
MPPLHVGLAMLLFEHIFPQPPQFPEFVSELTSHPLPALWSQSSHPA